jgi:peptidyl-prolyl cis-trans isomerase SurA
LIENRSAAIKEQANAKYRQLLSQFPDEKTLLPLISSEMLTK